MLITIMYTNKKYHLHSNFTKAHCEAKLIQVNREGCYVKVIKILTYDSHFHYNSFNFQIC